MKLIYLGYILSALLVWGPVRAAQASFHELGSVLSSALLWPVVFSTAEPELRLDYQPDGSGAGVGQLMQRTVDFAASDAPLTDQQLKEAPDVILHFPTVLGAAVLIYNIREVSPENKSLSLQERS